MSRLEPIAYRAERNKQVQQVLTVMFHEILDIDVNFFAGRDIERPANRVWFPGKPRKKGRQKV